MKSKKTKKHKEINLEQPVRDTKGKKVDSVSLNKKVFDGTVNMPLIHQVVTMYQASQRSGSASTKTRAEVRGGGKKPWRQKGTGRARTGSIRNPLWRGGGIIFGPRPRDMSYKLPQKIRKLAIKSSLNEKLINNNLVIIDKIELETHKTKELAKMLGSLGINGESAVVILDKVGGNIKLASRNIPKVIVKSTDNFNALDILRHKRLFIQQSALNNLMRVL